MRKRCDVRFSFDRRNRVFQKSGVRIGVRKLRMGLAPASGEVRPLASRLQKG